MTCEPVQDAENHLLCRRTGASPRLHVVAAWRMCSTSMPSSLTSKRPVGPFDESPTQLIGEALEPVRVAAGIGSARFADELGWAFVEADHGPLRVKLLGIEVEHILHAGDELGVDLGDAPHVLLPRLEMVLGRQASADGFTRETIMVGQLDPSRQPAAPASSGRDLRAGFEQVVAMRRASSLLVSLRSASPAAPRSGRLRDYL